MIASSRHADPECGRQVEMAAVGLEKVDWYAQCHWSGQLWRLKDKLSGEEVKYLDEVRRYTAFKRKGSYLKKKIMSEYVSYLIFVLLNIDFKKCPYVLISICTKTSREIHHRHAALDCCM